MQSGVDLDLPEREKSVGGPSIYKRNLAGVGKKVNNQEEG
jgi:hypothetical protein